MWLTGNSGQPLRRMLLPENQMNYLQMDRILILRGSCHRIDKWLFLIPFYWIGSDADLAGFFFHLGSAETKKRHHPANWREKPARALALLDAFHLPFTRSTHPCFGVFRTRAHAGSHRSWTVSPRGSIRIKITEIELAFLNRKQTVDLGNCSVFPNSSDLH